MNPQTDKIAPREGIEAFLMVLAIAALFYGFRLGSWSLGGSEAYSALAASQDSVGAVVEQALRFDPGKPPLYQILLHWFVGLFGCSETSLRAFSAICALATLILLYSLGVSMLGPRAALAAVVICALNPFAFILGQWARMYSMFICTVVASMLTFWRVRQQANRSRLAAFAICATLMLYTHLCSLLFAGVEVAVLTRDFYRGRRAAAPWAGLAIAFAPFMPFLPTAVAQARGMLFTHWLDWIGSAHAVPAWYRAAAVVVAALLVLGLVFGRQFESDDREPLRFCALWLLIPVITLGAASIVVRPVFSPRYVAPAAPALALLIANGLGLFGARIQNLAATSIATAFVVLFFFYRARQYEPWHDIAQAVTATGTAQPVFFESGLVVSDSSGTVQASQSFNSGFPEGYFRVPFDYYFKGPNPRETIDPSNPVRAREQIAEAAARAGGAWLISGKTDVTARSEMPNSGRFRIDRILHHDYATLYQIVPLTQWQF
jgi:uncharacterized membrane protein